MRRNSHIEAAREELERHGAVVIGVDHDHVHPRVRYQWRGQERFYVTASTPGDQRGVRNVRSSIRHELGVIVPQKRVGMRKSKKVRAGCTPVRPPSEITIIPDPMTPLNEHEHAQAVLSLRLQRAFQEFWDDCLAAVGCRPWWRMEGSMTHVTGELTMLQAWAAFNATRLPGGEWAFDTFMTRARHMAGKIVVTLDEGYAVVAPGPLVSFADVEGAELVPMPMDAERYAKWLMRGNLKEVA